MRAAVFPQGGYCPKCNVPLGIDPVRTSGRCGLCGGEFHHSMLEERLRKIERQIDQIEDRRESRDYLDAPADHRWCVVVTHGAAVWVEGRFRNQDEAIRHEATLRQIKGSGYVFRVARLEEPER